MLAAMISSGEQVTAGSARSRFAHACGLRGCDESAATPFPRQTAQRTARRVAPAIAREARMLIRSRHHSAPGFQGPQKVSRLAIEQEQGLFCAAVGQLLLHRCARFA